MSASTYVSSGAFEADLERLVGPLDSKDADEDEDEDEDEEEDDLRPSDFISKLPVDLAREVSALHALTTSKEIPSLCGLEVGSFVTIPAQHGLDAAGVRDEEWFGPDSDIEVVMSSIEIFTESGSPYFLIGPFGVVELNEDPHSFVIIADGLEPFLRTLLALEAVARGSGTVAAAEEAVRTHLRTGLRSAVRRTSRGTAPKPAEHLPRFAARILGTKR
jgi:hypothetical protein